MKPKKIPLRMCAGCQERKSKKELVRVVRGPDGGISLDLGGKKAGRGAYVCPDPNCLKLAKKRKSLERSFECPVPDEVFVKLEEELLKRVE